MAQTKSRVVLVMGGVTLVVVAYLIGTQSAGWVEGLHLAWQVDKYRTSAAEQTAVILREMGTIKVGDTLANFSFEDIDGKSHLLSELVTDKTLIIYLQPDCDACLTELERLRNTAQGPDDYEHILLITSSNPLHLQKLRADYGLGCVILYDEERRFGTALKIQTFPFNLVVDRSLAIQAIHANTLLPDDYERLFEEAHVRNVECTGVSTYPASLIVGQVPCGPADRGRSTGLLPYGYVTPAKADAQSSWTVRRTSKSTAKV